MSTIPESEADTLNAKLLVSSFLKIELQSEDFATTFYNILFSQYPSIRKLFSETDMMKQRIP